MRELELVFIGGYWILHAVVLLRTHGRPYNAHGSIAGRGLCVGANLVVVAQTALLPSGCRARNDGAMNGFCDQRIETPERYHKFPRTRQAPP